MRAEASAIGEKWNGRGRSQEDDHGLTIEINEFGLREPISAEIGLAVFEKRSDGRTHRQTDTSPLFIYKLQCLASPGGQHPGNTLITQIIDLQTLFAVNDRQTVQTHTQTDRQVRSPLEVEIIAESI